MDGWDGTKEVKELRQNGAVQCASLYEAIGGCDWRSLDESSPVTNYLYGQSFRNE